MEVEPTTDAHGDFRPKLLSKAGRTQSLLHMIQLTPSRPALTQPPISLRDVRHNGLQQSVKDEPRAKSQDSRLSQDSEGELDGELTEDACALEKRS